MASEEVNRFVGKFCLLILYFLFIVPFMAIISWVIPPFAIHLLMKLRNPEFISRLKKGEWQVFFGIDYKTKKLWKCILLTLLGWLPGSLFAFYNYFKRGKVFIDESYDALEKLFIPTSKIPLDNTLKQ